MRSDLQRYQTPCARNLSISNGLMEELLQPLFIIIIIVIIIEIFACGRAILKSGTIYNRSIQIA